jgi:hypothetical protein
VPFAARLGPVMFELPPERGPPTRKRVYTNILTAWSKVVRYVTRHMGMTGLQTTGRTWITPSATVCRVIAIICALGLLWGMLNGLGGRSGDPVAHRKLGQHIPSTSLQADSQDSKARTEEVQQVCHLCHKCSVR